MAEINVDANANTGIEIAAISSVPVFRYNLTKDFMQELQRFSHCHRHDVQDDYKTAWDEWCDEHEEEISAEKRLLKQKGYTGDADDKIYKSARYYFRNKSTEKKTPVNRRTYISMERETLDAIDKHIVDCTALVNGMKKISTPADGFEDFCQNQTTIITEGARRLLEQGLSQEEVISKFKKTYKNRYFTYTRRLERNAIAEAKAKAQAEQTSDGKTV